jgi:hypothetical protein
VAARRIDPSRRPGYNRGVRALTTDFADAEARPYFFWDEDVSVQELRAVLSGPDSPRRDQLLAKMLREARDTDVWAFVTPREVARKLPDLGRRLGRRQGFWEWLIEGWRSDGIL